MSKLLWPFLPWEQKGPNTDEHELCKYERKYQNTDLPPIISSGYKFRVFSHYPYHKKQEVMKKNNVRKDEGELVSLIS
jgi:hypothetical protein